MRLRFREWEAAYTEATKVVDADGRPRVVWHGTRNGHFDKFHSSYIGQTDPGFYGRGFYFSAEREDAEGYGPARPFHLNIENPFTIETHGDVCHDSLYDLRDRLADLKGMPPELRTKRHMPDGYEMESEEIDNPYYDPVRTPQAKPKFTKYRLAPKPEHWDDLAYSYGREEDSPLKAIVHHHDKNDNDGQFSSPVSASQLIKWTGKRDEFVDILKAHGYDGIFVVNADTKEVIEYMAFDPDQITPA